MPTPRPPKRNFPRAFEDEDTYILMKWADIYKDSMLDVWDPLSRKRESNAAVEDLFRIFENRKRGTPPHPDAIAEATLVISAMQQREVGRVTVLRPTEAAFEFMRMKYSTSKLTANGLCGAFPRYIGAVMSPHIEKDVIKMAGAKYADDLKGKDLLYVVTTYAGKRPQEVVPLATGLTTEMPYSRAADAMESALDWVRSISFQIVHAIWCTCKWYGTTYAAPRNEDNNPSVRFVGNVHADTSWYDFSTMADGAKEDIFTSASVPMEIVHVGEKSQHLLPRVTLSSATWISDRGASTLSYSKNTPRPLTTIIIEMIDSITPGNIPEWIPGETTEAIERRLGLKKNPESKPLVEPGEQEIMVSPTNWDYWESKSLEVKDFLIFVRKLWERRAAWDDMIRANRDHQLLFAHGSPVLEEAKWESELEFLEEDILQDEFFDALYANAKTNSYDRRAGKLKRVEDYAYFPKPFEIAWLNLAV